MPDNNLRQISVILYRLKRSYGMSITVCSPIVNDTDLRTGVIERKYRKIKIRRAIVLPANATRDFVYDLSYIAANKNFTYGGYFDVEGRIIIIDNKDMPKDFSLSKNDHIEFNDDQYELKSFVKTADDKSYLIHAKHIISTGN